MCHEKWMDKWINLRLFALTVVVTYFYLWVKIGFCSLIYNTFYLQWFIKNNSTIQQNESTTHPLVLVDSTQQLQALALQQAVWGISCLVLHPSFCNDSSLHPSFSNNSSSHCCDLTIIVDSTHEHFCNTPEMSIADISSHWNKAWAEARGWT